MEIVMSHEWLERIESKIDAQGKEQQRMAAVLDTHTARLDSMDVRLEAQGKSLEKHRTLLEGHSDLLEAQSKRLDRHENELHRVRILVEKMGDDLRGVAEGFAGLTERMDREFKALRDRLDERIAPIEDASRHFTSTLANHERRLPKPARRRRR